MYPTLIFFHSIFRWLVVASLLFAIYRAYRGYTKGTTFSKADNASRHWTATIAHIQLMIGMLLYIKSPLVQYFWKNMSTAIKSLDASFFALIHFLLMLTAIVILTIGSAMAKRKQADREKFKTMLTWFLLALLIILIAIPWPFSLLANRPYLRPL